MNASATGLDRLHDIVVPAAAPLWPPAPGMALLLVLAAGTFFVVSVRAILRYQHNRYRSEALAELKRIKRMRDQAAQFAAIAALLKRTALTAYPRAEVAPLSGEAWHIFLDHAVGATLFTAGAGSLLTRTVYDPRVSVDLTPDEIRTIFTATRYWIKKHRPSDSPV